MGFLDQAGQQAADDRLKGMGVANEFDEPMPEEPAADPIALANQIVDLGIQLADALGGEEKAEGEIPPPPGPPPGPPPMA